MRYDFLGLGVRAVRVHGDHAHVVIGARPSGRTGHFGQVVGTQEGIPEGLGRAVAVENIGRQQLHILFARGLLEGCAHGDDAAQGRQVDRGALLGAGEHGQNGRHADEEGDLIALGVFQAGARVEIAQNDHLTADIERRARAARVDAAAVEPRGHIHGAVGRGERKVHNHIVCRQHLIDVIDRHALGAVGCARGVKTGGFVVDMRVKIDRRVGLGLTVHIVIKGRIPLSTSHQHPVGLVLSQRERIL